MNLTNFREQQLEVSEYRPRLDSSDEVTPHAERRLLRALQGPP
jgi:hypothetical protein